ncbi:MAG: PAS domain S-box protein [Acidimicrobiaceae bacterium]|nr:PAS domain S-box protein [Acidimicrobiaceae bacterium]
MTHGQNEVEANSFGFCEESLKEFVRDFVENYNESVLDDKPLALMVSHLNEAELSMVKKELIDYIHVLIEPSSDDESISVASKKVTRSLLSVGISIDWLLKIVPKFIEVTRSAPSTDALGAKAVRAAASRLESRFNGQILVILDIERQHDDGRFLEIEELAQFTQRATSTSHLMRLLFGSLIKSEGIAGAYFGRFNLEGQMEYEHVVGETFIEISRLASQKKIALISNRADLITGAGPAGRAWRTGQIQVSSAIQSDPTMAPWAECYSGLGIRCTAAIPIMNSDGRIEGLIGLYSTWPGYFAKSSRLKILELARQIVGAAIERLASTKVISYETRTTMRNLIRDRRVEMCYQPIVDLQTGELHKVEALARLNPKGGSGLIYPGDFLPALGVEDFLTLFEIGLVQSCKSLTDWERMGIRTSVSVNFPPQGFSDPRYLRVLAKTIESSEIDPSRLTLELTEEKELNELDISAKVLHALKELGIKLSQDDLGSGFSSLHRLEKIGFDEVKIDQTLVRNPTDPKSPLKLIEHLTSLAHDLDLSVVVEGLESESLIEVATIMGADYGQGYAIAKPMPGKEIADFAKRIRWQNKSDQPRTSLGGIAKLRRWSCRVESVASYPEVLTDERLIGELRNSLIYLINPRIDAILSQLEGALSLGAGSQYRSIRHMLEDALWNANPNDRNVLAPKTDGDEIEYEPKGLSELTSDELRKLISLSWELTQIGFTKSNLASELEHICLTAESHISDATAAIMFLDRDNQLNLGYAPSMSPAARQAMAVIKLTSGSGSCANAVLSGGPVFVGNTFLDPRWSELSNLATSLGIKSCWSVPIRDKQSKIIGTMSMSHPHHKMPTPYQREIIEYCARTAATALTEPLDARAEPSDSIVFGGSQLFEPSKKIKISVADGKLFDPSPGFMAMYGYSEEDFEDLTLFDLNLSINPSVLAEMAERTELGGVIHMTSTHRTKAGETKEVEFYSTLKRQNGKDYFETALADITDLSQSEKLLAAEHESRTRLLKTSSVLITVVDPLGMTLMVNHAVSGLLAMSEQQLIGQLFPIALLAEGPDRKKIRDAFSRATRTRLCESIEAWITSARGQRRLLAIDVIPNFDNLGALNAYVCTGVDITERFEATASISRQEAFVSQIIESIPGIVVVLDAAGAIIQCNEALEEFTGIEFDKMKDRPFYHLNFFAPKARPAAVKWFHAAIERGSAERTFAPWVHKDGSTHTFEWRSSFINGSDDKVRFVVVVGNDITDEDQNLKELQRAAAVFENSSEGIVIADKNAIILDINGGYTRITGYSRSESIGKNAGFIGSDIHDQTFYQDMYDSLKERSRWSGTIWNRRKDGAEFPALMHITAIRNSYGQIDHYAGIFSDITEIVQYQKQLSEMAFHDILTGLANRSLLVEMISSRMAEARRSGNVLALAYMDLDNFKPVNDLYGHAEGDRLLIELSKRLKNELREVDTVARIGGDEFVCLLPGLYDKMECEEIVLRLISRIEEPFQLSDAKTFFSLSASIGVAFYEHDDTDPDNLLRQADQLMYVAKRSGGRSFITSDDITKG